MNRTSVDEKALASETKKSGEGFDSVFARTLSGEEFRAPPSHVKTVDMIPAPLVRQCFDFDCGCACLQSILRMFGFNLRSEFVVRALRMSSEDPIDCHMVSDFLSCFSIDAFETEMNDIRELEKHLQKSRPAMTAIQAWGGKSEMDALESGHFVLCTGCDEKNIYFMDPSILGNYGFLPKKEFEQRWKDTDKYGARVLRYAIVLEKLRDKMFFKRRGQWVFSKTL